MKRVLAIAGLGLTIACASSNFPVTSAPGLSSDSKISILFQDFPAGTVCSVQTQQNTLQQATLPGKIDYQAEFAAAPVSCRASDGTTYDVDVGSVVPDSFRVAGLTAYGTGILVSTVSAGELLSLRNDAGVTRR